MGDNFFCLLIVVVILCVLFDFEESYVLFESDGVVVYVEFQCQYEDDIFGFGVVFFVVCKLLVLNQGVSLENSWVEVILLLCNLVDIGLCIFNLIQYYGLGIICVMFIVGELIWLYVKLFGIDLFLLVNLELVCSVLCYGIVVVIILFKLLGEIVVVVVDQIDIGCLVGQLCIVFDGDVVIFGDESECILCEQGVEVFGCYECECVCELFSGGFFRGFLLVLYMLQEVFLVGDSVLICIVLVIVCLVLVYEWVICILWEWGVCLDEVLFFGGCYKGLFLQVFGVDIFFDDLQYNIDSVCVYVVVGYVLYGVVNEGQGGFDWQVLIVGWCCCQVMGLIKGCLIFLVVGLLFFSVGFVVLVLFLMVVGWGCD